jgi:hypothetical protein
VADNLKYFENNQRNFRMEIEKRSNDAKKFHDLTLQANLKNHTVARDFERQR